MDLFSFSGWKKKALRFVVKSAMGRFLKEVEQHHVVEPTFTRSCMKFGLERLEVDEDRVNEELLADAPIRMAFGTINLFEGDIAFASQGVRNISLEGIDFTFDLISRQSSMRPAASADERREEHFGTAAASSGGNNNGTNSMYASSCGSAARRSRGGVLSNDSAAGSTMFSSLLSGDISEDAIASEILNDGDDDENPFDNDDEYNNDDGGERGAVPPTSFRGGGGHDDRTIDNGVSAISQSIKALVHSLSLTVRNVNIRIRCPPPGKEIAPNAALPAGTVELVISLPNEVSVKDYGSNQSDIGNSFKKLIQFSGLRASIYEASASQYEMRGEDVAVQKMSLRDVILSGGVEEVDNQIIVQYQDVLPDSLLVPTWSTDVQLNQLHAILGPTQLLRLSTMAQHLLEAPEVTESSGKTRKDAAKDRSKLKVRCTAMSVSLLYDDAREMVASAWRTFNSSRLHSIEESLRGVRYYSIRSASLMVVSYNASLHTDEADDEHFKVFDRYGGSSLNFGVTSFFVAEHRPNFPQLTLLAIGRAAAAEKSSQATLVCVVRTTCPLTARLARECGVAVDSNITSSVVRQDVTVQSRSSVEVNFDVEVLERLIKFGKRLEYLVTKAAAVLAAVEAASEKAKGLKEDSASVNPFNLNANVTSDYPSVAYSAYSMASPSYPNIFSPHPTGLDSHFNNNMKNSEREGGSSRDGASPYHPNNNAQPRARGPAAPCYTVIRTVSILIPTVSTRILFPITRKPSGDVYGPLTQRLFRQVLEHTRHEQPQSAHSTTTSGARRSVSPLRNSPSSHAPKHWRKTLIVELSAVVVRLPKGDATHIILDVEKGVIMEWDTVTHETNKLCQAILSRSAPSSRAPRDSGAAARSNSASGGRRSLSPGLGGPSTGPTRRQQKTLFQPQHTIEIIRREAAASPAPHEVVFTSTTDWSGTEHTEGRVSDLSDVSVFLSIPSLTAQLHQDDLLLLLFMVGEINDCVADALKSLDPIQIEEEEKRRLGLDGSGAAEAMDDLSRHCANASFAKEGLAAFAAAATAAPSPAFGASVRIAVGAADVTLWVPRLGADGVPIGEPLWMTITPENRRLIRKEVFFHKYGLGAKGLGVFLYSYAPENCDKFTGEMLVNVRAASLDLLETLPELPSNMPGFSPPETANTEPQWGRCIPLVNSYAALYNKSHNGCERDQTALTMCMRRSMGMARVDTDIHISLDRLSLVHQTAYEGDHWLMALLQFVGDVPTEAGHSDNEESGADSDHLGGSIFIENTPPRTSTRLTLVANDSLIQYQPFGYVCRMVALVPTLVVRTDPITSTSKRSLVHISFTNATVYLINEFLEELLSHDHHRAGQSSFGVTRGGIAQDLENIGFVSVLSVSSQLGVSEPCVCLRMFDVPGKPIVVENRKLSAELGCACDSFYLFQTVMSHYVGGYDLQYVPTPEMFVAAIDGKGRMRRSDRDKERSRQPEVRVLVDGLASRVRELLAQSVFAIDGEGDGRSNVFGHHDPCSPMSSDFVQVDEEGEQYLPAQQQAYALARAIVESSQREPVVTSAAGVLEGDDDGFEVVDFAKGSTAQRQQCKWNINPNLSKYLSSGLNCRAAKERLQADVELATKGVVSPTAAPQTSNSNNDYVSPTRIHSFNLESFMIKEDYFSQWNPDVCQGDDGNAEADARLVDCPEVAVEVRVSDCTCVTRFFGGLDFYGIRANKEFCQTLLQTQSMLFYTGNPTDPNNICYRSTRCRNVSIEAKLFSVSAQIDLFVAGHTKTMQMILKVRDAEILDRIDTSGVRTILMCSIPATLRDNDGNLFEMKWVSTVATTAASQAFSQNIPMEDISIRLQPLVINVHRRDIDLILDFVNVSNQTLNEVLQIDAAPSQMYFKRLFIHPITADIYARTEATELAQAFKGQSSKGAAYEFANFLMPSIEGSKVSLGKIEILNTHVDQIGEALMEALTQEMWGIEKVLLLLCGLEVVRTVNEAGQAAGELVLRPLDYYRRNKSLYTGIVKGLSGFGRRIGAETMRVGACTARTAHYVAHAGTSMVTNSPSMARGAQPKGAADGLNKAAIEVCDGFVEARDILRYSFYNDRGSVLDIPLAPLAMTDGMFRAVTMVLEGFRNSLRPEQRDLERKLYKSKFEGAVNGRW